MTIDISDYTTQRLIAEAEARAEQDQASAVVGPAVRGWRATTRETAAFWAYVAAKASASGRRRFEQAREGRG